MAQIYKDQMFNTATNSTTLTALNSGVTTTAGTYTPKADGFLVKVQVLLGGQAATSLIQSGYIQLVCTKWTPINALIFPFQGSALMTAPAFGGNTLLFEDVVNLPVSTALPITGNYIFNYTATTPYLAVSGIFTAG